MDFFEKIHCHPGQLIKILFGFLTKTQVSLFLYFVHFSTLSSSHKSYFAASRLEPSSKLMAQMCMKMKFKFNLLPNSGPSTENSVKIMQIA